jgi:hypothetical protein
MSRPSPTFSPASVSVATTNPVSAAPAQVPKSTFAPAPVVEPAQVETAPPAPAHAPALEPVAVAPQPVVTPASAPVPVETIQPETQVAPAPAAAASHDTEKSLARIKEIKSSVNERVGNPVNLVDINNEVGREYMGAMLEAMKKLNTGSAAVSAMQRLEAAYIQVEKTLQDNPSVGPSSTPTPTPTPTPKPVATPVPEEAVATPAPATSEPVVEAAPTPAPKPIVAPEPTPAPVSEAVQPTAHSTVPVRTAAPESVPTPKSEDNRWGPATDTLGAAKEVLAKSNENIKSVSVGDNPVKLKTPADLPEASSLETSSIAGDPLFTKEVDEGLDQLLVEWSIFKKSGLFGTGPKGRQHPLFLKVAGLQIPLLLAGRFEGATQEIKQSITDYMNGWRYEQGIIYNQGENFEHYLRRVIRHIIDLQNK